MPNVSSDPGNDSIESIDREREEIGTGSNGPTTDPPNSTYDPGKALRPVTIKQMLNAQPAYSESESDAHFTIDGYEIKDVTTVGHVFYMDTSHPMSNVYHLQDGCGEHIVARHWTGDMPNKTKGDVGLKEHAFVRVTGYLVRFRDYRNTLNVLSIRRVAGFHEMCYHLLDAIVATLAYERGPPFRGSSHKIHKTRIEGSQVQAEKPAVCTGPETNVSLSVPTPNLALEQSPRSASPPLITAGLSINADSDSDFQFSDIDDIIASTKLETLMQGANGKGKEKNLDTTPVSVCTSDDADSTLTSPLGNFHGLGTAGSAIAEEKRTSGDALPQRLGRHDPSNVSPINTVTQASSSGHRVKSECPTSPLAPSRPTESHSHLRRPAHAVDQAPRAPHSTTSRFAAESSASPPPPSSPLDLSPGPTPKRSHSRRHYRDPYSNLTALQRSIILYISEAKTNSGASSGYYRDLLHQPERYWEGVHVHVLGQVLANGASQHGGSAEVW